MRKIDTLRISVTDRCNLRCIYCMPPEGVALIPHEEVLRFEEIERVTRAAARAGARKVRITGGEPLVRANVVELVRRLARIEDVLDLPMTTNGVLLAEKARDLKAAGLSRVTVSLDTLRPERFARIAGSPGLDRVRLGIEAALAAGLVPLKVNVVVVPGENDDEVEAFARLAAELDLEVRFIERMPIFGHGRGPHCGLTGASYLPSAAIRDRIGAALGPLEPVIATGSSPARVFRLPGGKGRIGFISPISEPFCRYCSRMRLTPDGKLRACLAQELELDVKGPLRSGIDDDGLLELYRRAVGMKPKQDAACFSAKDRVMSQIGG